MTFSIAAHDERSGEFGAATCTSVPCVAAIVPHVSLRGAVCTQAQANVDLGLRAMQLLDHGLTVSRAVAALLDQEHDRNRRQIFGIDITGDRFGFTGTDCLDLKAHLIGDDHIVGGNKLVSDRVLPAMRDAFIASEGQDLVLRLIAALEAGRDQGGDRDGTQSAGLVVASPHPKLSHNIRSDEHSDPIAELRRIYPIAETAGRELAERFSGSVELRPVYWRIVRDLPDRVS